MPVNLEDMDVIKKELSHEFISRTEFHNYENKVSTKLNEGTVCFNSIKKDLDVIKKSFEKKDGVKIALVSAVTGSTVSTVLLFVFNLLKNNL